MLMADGNVGVWEVYCGREREGGRHCGWELRIVDLPHHCLGSFPHPCTTIHFSRLFYARCYAPARSAAPFTPFTLLFCSLRYARLTLVKVILICLALRAAPSHRVELVAHVAALSERAEGRAEVDWG